MRKVLDRFRKDEAGAVSIDWVVLTAAIVAVQIGVMVYNMQGSMLHVTDGVNDKIDIYGEMLE